MVYNTVNQWEYSTLQYRARKQLKDRRVNRTGGISYRVKIAPLNSSWNTPPLELQTNKQTNKQTSFRNPQKEVPLQDNAS